MEGDESWESGIREGETLHEEALLIAVQAGYLIGHPVRAQDALIGLTGILGAYGKRNGCSENVKGSRAGQGKQPFLSYPQPRSKEGTGLWEWWGEAVLPKRQGKFPPAQLIASTHLSYKKMQTGAGEAIWLLRQLAVLAPVHRG